MHDTQIDLADNSIKHSGDRIALPGAGWQSRSQCQPAYLMREGCYFIVVTETAA